MSLNDIFLYIINIGIDERLSDDEVKKIKIHNQLSFVSASLLSIFPVLFLVLQMYEGMILCLFGSIPVILPYVLNYYRQFELSRLLSIIFGYNVFLIGIVFFGYDCGFAYGIFAVLVLPILYFHQTKYRLLIYIFLALETILILCFLHHHIPFFYEPEQKDLLNSILFVACAALVVSYFISADSTNNFYEKQNIQLVNKLTQRNEELKHLSYSTSHDLRQPLSTILNFVSLFNKKKSAHLDEEGKIFLNYIEKASTKLDHLIEGMLQHSLLGQSEATSNFDSNQLLEEIILELKDLIEKHYAIISIERLPILFGNPEEIKGVFRSLIRNAIKFRRADVAPIIHVHVKKTANYWLFSVVDNGIGIEEDLHHKIFQIFQKGHSNTSIKGEGIGLANCKKVIELHGGKIWVESTINKGSTFYFTLKEVKQS